MPDNNAPVRCLHVYAVTMIYIEIGDKASLNYAKVVYKFNQVL